MSPSVIHAPSPNFNDRPAPVSILVLHYTGMETGAAALERLRDPQAKVSSHYLVEEDGRVFALVSEDKRAWHAGAGAWRGCRDVNSASIGIEIVNGGHDFDLPDFADAQIKAVTALCRDILARHAIAARDVIGHSDMAPARKADPGEKFPWRTLAEAGIGLWPEAPVAGLSADAAPAALAAIGYPAADNALADVVTAFQRRFRPARVDGRLDDETLGLIAAVQALSA
ncbi:N-acetylmuramoyl-L-alanine amidase [Alkalicaulis satelles]|uniref:N-acetylmuramoyl-L-alanine amidase n=1 Tax=Alkalicaulis satelles TaxID=2609175 RepID=A0A5M6ZSK5_9PROT|nr:N-acetylmuramoyl-L-alanine amidase [Alkalicaulis satelles]KAA5805301.1 N-acetylmuramoyl-L-alanine amidase [Alkalicaulis satelles]